MYDKICSFFYFFKIHLWFFLFSLHSNTFGIINHYKSADYWSRHYTSTNFDSLNLQSLLYYVLNIKRSTCNCELYHISLPCFFLCSSFSFSLKILYFLKYIDFHFCKHNSLNSRTTSICTNNLICVFFMFIYKSMLLNNNL